MSVKKVAVIGLGDISGIYLKNIARVFQNIELYEVCTHRVERAREAAAEYGASRVYETMEQAFADPEVDIVVNLTRPMEHFDAVSYTHLDVYKRQDCASAPAVRRQRMTTLQASSIKKFLPLQPRQPTALSTFLRSPMFPKPILTMSKAFMIFILSVKI